MRYTKAQEKRFRAWLLKEAEETGKGRDYAAEKHAEREPLYNSGWKNFAVTAPPECVEYLKNAYENYKESHPKMFNVSDKKS